jgi:hypothetical protein
LMDLTPVGGNLESPSNCLTLLQSVEEIL